MAGENAKRFSTHTAVSGGSDGNKNGEKKDLWSSMLDKATSAQPLPKKNILLLGGTVDSQREFFESLASSELKRTFDRNGYKIPPVANSFALGYTYYDVLDADQEDTLARISLYTLTSPAPSFASLIRPILTPESIPNTLIVILLDWSKPRKWMRQLRQWIFLLRTIMPELGPECEETMEEVMASWKDRGRGGGTNLDGTASGPPNDIALPLGPGEWEDALGLPLCVVCQNAENMEVFEKNHGWREEEFDQILQFLRTVLLRHGASLIYTTPSTPSQLPSLIHSSLGIHSLLKKSPLKHNVIDRDKIMVPPNWDSWGKIRVLRDGFDVELVSKGWGIDLIEHPQKGPRKKEDGKTGEENADQGESDDDEYDDGSEDDDQSEEPEGSTVALYESQVRDNDESALHSASKASQSTKLEVETMDTQTFLAEQAKALEKYRQKEEESSRDEAARSKVAKSNNYSSRSDDDEHGYYDGEKPITESKGLEHVIGPVQFNMGGIQVDADDMVQRLRERQTNQTGNAEGEDVGEDAGEDVAPLDTEKLQDFFQNLMNRRGGPGK
ncbi:Dynein light intermediate chain (DLIC) domain containing protein [Rhypophila sp. PSN 637]